MQKYPDIDMFLHRPLLTNPPMLALRELSDGTYSLADIALMHDIIDFKQELIDNEQVVQ